MQSINELRACETDYPEIDGGGAVLRLASALRCRTVGYADAAQVDWGEFEKLRGLMRSGFPLLNRAARMEVIGQSVLYTMPGSDPSLDPVLFMAHQDVVPVVPGTEQNWTHGPFSGDISAEGIWGRGALDIKEMVFGILEAAETMLRRGTEFRRTMIFAFGEDEETLNTGARALANVLDSRGIRPVFLLDEGSSSPEDGSLFGAAGLPILQVGLLEKGYGDLELQARGCGGHSSNPFGGTSLARLCRAVDRICSAPFPARLPAALEHAFSVLAPQITDPEILPLASDPAANADRIAALLLRRRESFPFVTTTVAPTMISGSSDAPNVMPQDMQAVINFRIAPGTTADEVFEHCRRAVDDDSILMYWLQCNDPSRPSRSDSWGFRELVRTAGRYYPAVTVVPSMAAGASDARQYEGICDVCMRMTPFLVDEALGRIGVHGPDEHIPAASYLQGIRFLMNLMENTCL